jgi:hypothetical protein
METQYAVYLGKEQQNGFTGFHAEKNFFCVVEIFDGYTLEQGEDLMSALAQAGSAAFDSLAGFDASISGILRRHNIPLDTSVATGYAKDNVLFLKTVGSGEIYIHRGKATERIMFGNTMASGQCTAADTFIFTTSFFTQSLKGVQRIKDCLHSRRPLAEYPDYIKSQIGEEDDTGAVALIVLAGDRSTKTDVMGDPSDMLPVNSHDPASNLSSGMRNFFMKVPYKKPIIGAVLGVCVIALLWNVLGGWVSKKSGGPTTDLSKVEQLVSDMEAAKDDRAKALDLAEQARDELNVMKKTDAVTALMRKVGQLEDEVLARETHEPQDFYELTIEEKSAKGIRFNLAAEMSYILDEQGKVYLFSLEKKSFLKRSYGKPFSSGTVIAGDEKKAYVLDPAVGVIELLDGGTSKVVIKKDEAWKNIGGMQLYNGNIYILERDGGDIFKYPVFSEGFGDRTSYFKGSYDVIGDTSTFAIDSSVYVSTDDQIAKYTSGLKDEEQFAFPQKQVHITKVIAHSEEEGVSVWSKDTGTIYRFTKDGVYQKQIASSVFKSGSDVEVYNKAAFVLKDNKIYRVAL